ncbi:PucR family transcriptional regulator [Labedella populi]|uniref:PucR family transcriptional regulator n=1 Tax=Labedella populi TaxID=2498850 RepID=UPI001407DCBF|nr:PucR family transcriptional regulator ligand-binding domain-containing protein [Labedella populi]
MRVPTTLRALLATPAFRLRLVAGAEAASPVLDEPLLWAHNSDLLDPTPWLEPGGFLLTDGTHLGPGSRREEVDAYVSRLVASGTRALGFATGIVHDVIPAVLVDGCVRGSLPLLEVADRTPFMSIIRHVSDVLAAEQRERLEWSLAAQRAIARAALRPDGLGAILDELERRLDCWVALFDPLGNRIDVRTRIPMPDGAESVVEEAVRAALARGNRSSARVIVGSDAVTVQTVGQRGRIRGALVVGTAAPLDAAETDLVASVIALASIALEQSRTVETARRQLRSGLLELVLSGVVDVASRTAQRLGGRLPDAPVRVAVISIADEGRSLLDELDLLSGTDSGRVFVAERDDEIVAVVAAGDEPVAESSVHSASGSFERVLARRGVPVGLSAPIGWNDLSRGLAEARQAATRATTDRPVVRFEGLAEEGMLGLLQASGAETLARRFLAPLLALPVAERELAVRTATVWLEHNGAWDPPAKELGIHRQTLRNRISSLESLLGIDLGAFSARSELWTSLRLLFPSPSPH